MEFLIFSQRKDFLKLTNKPSYAAFTQPGLRETLLVVGPDQHNTRKLEGIQHNALHEYTHYLLRQQPRSFPPWYEEGLATVLGHTDISVDPDDERIYNISFGMPRQSSTGRMSIDNAMNVKYYIDLPPRRLRSFYTTSAALVHYLLFAHEAGHPDYRSALADYLVHRNPEAWSTGALHLPTLSKAVRTFQRRRRAPSRTHHQVRLDPAELLSQPLPAAELTRLIARSAHAINPREAVRIYTSLLDEDPQNIALANARVRSLIEVDRQAASAALRVLAERAPHDTGVLINEAAIATRDCVLRADVQCREVWRRASRLLRRALKQNPERIDAIMLLGVAELYGGRPGRAASYLEATLKRVPWSPVVNFYYGECQRLLGSSRARDHLEKARSWALRTYIRNLAEASLEQMREAAR